MGHHLVLLNKVGDPTARIWYLRRTALEGWSRNMLHYHIKGRAHQRGMKSGVGNNFPVTLAPAIAAQAEEALRSGYNLEFLGVARVLDERDLETRLIRQVRDFILELGYGFCFIAEQHPLRVGRKDFAVDLLFYHRFLRSLVAIDLKVGEFEPEHVGKMDFYLNVLNDRERASDDNPSIGIILCADNDDLEVEYSLRTKNNPIGVANYALVSEVPRAMRGKLPTADQLKGVMAEALRSIEGRKRRSKR